MMFWDELPLPHKLALAAVVLLIAAAAVSGWVSSLSAWAEVRRYERQAAHQKAAADEALKRAAVVANEIRRKEVDLKKLENEADEKMHDLRNARRDSDDARAEYDRIRRERRETVPSTDELCRELAELGYACR